MPLTLLEVDLLLVTLSSSNPSSENEPRVIKLHEKFDEIRKQIEKELLDGQP